MHSFFEPPLIKMNRPFDGGDHPVSMYSSSNSFTLRKEKSYNNSKMTNEQLPYFNTEVL